MKVWHRAVIDIDEAEERRIFDHVLDRLIDGKFIRDMALYESSEPHPHNGDTDDIKLGPVGFHERYAVNEAAIRLRDLLKRKART